MPEPSATVVLVAEYRDPGSGRVTLSVLDIVVPGPAGPSDVVVPGPAGPCDIVVPRHLAAGRRA